MPITRTSGRSMNADLVENDVVYPARDIRMPGSLPRVI